MNVKEDASKMMNQILRESRHNNNFHEDNWDTTGVQIKKPKYEENNHFEIPEEYLKMSPEELKQAKEEKYERIKVQPSEISRGIAKSREHHFADPTIESIFINLYVQCEEQACHGAEQFCSSNTVSSLKKRIKHCKNSLEKKDLERQLNSLYKERKKRHD